MNLNRVPKITVISSEMLERSFKGVVKSAYLRITLYKTVANSWLTTINRNLDVFEK